MRLIRRNYPVLHVADNYSVSGFFDKKRLVKLKAKAMRRGVWFRALQRIDRVLIDLTIKVADTVRSAKLAKSILSLEKKLESAMESGVARIFKQVGLSLAKNLSIIAQKLGYTSAKDWACDRAFAVYLTVMHMNRSMAFKA